MCGILGAWLPKAHIDQHQFEGIVDTLVHRGPDERGIFIENDFFLGMRRLSIIDLKTGSQPIFNEDGTKLVFFNGEIYNYRELLPPLESKGHVFKTKSDTEVIVHSLEEGIQTVSSFRGMFAISHYDRKTRSLTLLRDRVGVKPIYYYHLPGRCFLYASEIKGIKALAKAIGIELRVNPQAIYHYLSFANIPQPLTIYENVRALLPGHILQFQNDEVSVSKYWDYSYQPKFDGSFDDAMDQAGTLIHESVQLRLRSDVPIGIFLSGGLDSSIVAYEAAKLNQNIQTFTVGFPDSPALDESLIATATAQRLGIKNTVLPLRIKPLETLFKISEVFDQPFADSSAIPSLEISKMAHEHVKVVLNGDGGDEQFGGYRRYGLARKLSMLPNVAFMGALLKYISYDRRSRTGFVERMLRISGLSDSQQYIALTTDLLFDEEIQNHWINKSLVNRTDDLINSNLLRNSGSLDRIMHWDRRFNLLSGLLVKMDMATSAHSVEGRSPFLDHKLFEFSSILPDSFKYRGSKSKYLLRRLYEKKLNMEVVQGSKKGFEVPLVKWLKNDFLGVCNEIVRRKDLGVYQYLDYDFVKNALLFKIYPEKNQGYLAYSILNLAIWLDRDKF